MYIRMKYPLERSAWIVDGNWMYTYWSFGTTTDSAS